MSRYILTASEIELSLPQNGICFEMQEISINVPKRWLLDSTQIHDAYDADRDSRFIRLVVSFTQIETQTLLTIPTFFKRDSANGPWKCNVRWTPTRIGIWKAHLNGAIGSGPNQIEQIDQAIDGEITVTADGRNGFLLYPPSAGNQRYFYQSQSDGSSQAKMLYGACRAWLVTSDKSLPPNSDKWTAHEYANRTDELLPALRDHGYSLLHQWFAPWEYQLIHLDHAEYWRGDDDQWQRHELKDSWTSYQSYDQGRADAFDRWLNQLVGDKDHETIYTLLAPLPHVSLQLKSHPWGGEGCWSMLDDPQQRPEKCNGFSTLVPATDFWSFFNAQSSAEINSPTAQLFDHQANYFRYLIARWSSSPAIGIWEIFDEIDGIGEDVGLLDQQTGWWQQKDLQQRQQWLKDINSLFAGTLIRSDGLHYAGDPYQHPLHCATTSHAGGIGEAGNINWNDLPGNNMSAGWHWYPMPSDRNIMHYWLKTVQGIESFGTIWQQKKPHFLGEFGYIDRFRSNEFPNLIYPSLYHFGLWASVFNGHAVSVMDWDDGKEYGEIRYRKSAGAFDHTHYPINNGECLSSLRKLVKDIDWQSIQTMPLNTDFICAEENTQKTFALSTHNNIHAWALFWRDNYRYTIKGLKLGSYQLTFYDPWSGAQLQQSLHEHKGDEFNIDAQTCLPDLIKARSDFNKQQNKCKGFDIYWTLIKQ